MKMNKLIALFIRKIMESSAPVEVGSIMGKTRLTPNQYLNICAFIDGRNLARKVRNGVYVRNHKTIEVYNAGGWLRHLSKEKRKRIWKRVTSFGELIKLLLP